MRLLVLVQFAFISNTKVLRRQTLVNEQRSGSLRSEVLLADVVWQERLENLMFTHFLLFIINCISDNILHIFRMHQSYVH